MGSAAAMTFSPKAWNNSLGCGSYISDVARRLCCLQQAGKDIVNNV
jgi:hypothetical protein